jgi:hypothetical protein
MTEDTPVTVEGCVRREADVPGRAPNVAEQAGVAEDFILTSTKMIKGAAPANARARTGDAPVGTSGSSPMFEISGIDEDELKRHVGKRVQIQGTFDNLDRAPASAEARSNDDLVEIEGTTIKAVPGDCPAK